MADALASPSAAWIYDAVLYLVDTSAFFDSNGDGIGDVGGLRRKLDYIVDLGVTGLCLLPIQPSPGSADGQDLADLTSVSPALGTLEDFKALARDVHRRGMHLLIDFVVGRTSDQHPWFQRAMSAPPGSPHRGWYLWSEQPERLDGDSTGGWARHPREDRSWYRYVGDASTPALNLDDSGVVRATASALRFWLRAGADGFRLHGLDHAPAREGNAGPLSWDGQAFTARLRRHLRGKRREPVVLALPAAVLEDHWGAAADATPYDLVTHPSIDAGVLQSFAHESCFPIVDAVRHGEAASPGTCWLTRLRDEAPLSLAGVTQEAADYLFRHYAADPRARFHAGIRRRLAPMLTNDRSRLQLAMSLLLTLPGTPVIYYGDEVQMGDNVYLPRGLGLRTPMQWTADRNAGFSPVEPHQLVRPVNMDSQHGYQTTNVAAHAHNSTSLLWWLKRFIALRRESRALCRGDLQLVSWADGPIFAYVRRFADEAVLCVANLSRHAQYAPLDLASFNGTRPYELWGGSRFPRVDTSPYPLVMAPHAFYAFRLTGEVELSSCFISYSSRNDGFAARLFQVLQDRGAECWKADRSLVPGARFRDAIREAIQRVGRFLLVVSPASLASAEVALEVELALAEDDRRRESDHSRDHFVIPVLIENVDPLPPEHWYRAVRGRYNESNFCGWQDREVFERELGRLVHGIAIVAPAEDEASP